MCQLKIEVLNPTEGFYFLSDTQQKDLNINPDIDKIYEAVEKNVFDGDKDTPQQTRAVIQDTYAQLRAAVREGFPSVKVEYNSPNRALLDNLSTNVGVFSSLKKHDMVRELVKELKDDKGNLRSFNDFKKTVAPVVKDYRETFLNREYDAAVKCSRAAAQWQKFQLSKRIYPNLKYIRTRSANPRADHLSLVGTILPIDDGFWNTYYPPNGWGCKCSAQPTDEKPTDAPPTPDDIDPAFAINFGKEGKVFDLEKHPYGQIPKKEFEQAASEARGALCSYERTKAWKDAKESGMEEKKVTVNRVPAPVGFNRNSYMKNLDYGHYFFDKLSILNNIEQVLKESTYVMSENKKPKQGVKQYHILQYGSNEDAVNLHIEERKDGTCWLYYIHKQKNHLKNTL